MASLDRQRAIDSAQIERETGDLFARCLEAFHVFANLPQLSEDMRVLSLNAELAAGRAGEKGTGVRALTQYTRELVNRLNSAMDEMTDLKGRVYAHSASAIRVFQRSALMERADQAILMAGAETPEKQNVLSKVNKARDESMMLALEQVRSMIDCVNKLENVSEGVSSVGSQAASISTNVAIEAALSGQFEGEFRQVATAMQEYVDHLRVMADNAARAIRDAISIGQDLHIRAHQNLNTL